MSYEGADFLSETVFDAVVIGTGLGETVLAAALARAGKNVLHLDKHTFYGSTMSTHTLSEFKNLLSKQSAAVPTTPTPTAPTAKGIPLSVETTIGASESEVVVDIDTEREYSHGQKGARLLRSVSIDNVPSLLYADGVTVDTLLQNGVDRYLEFQSVGGCKMLINGCSALCPIPNSRAALFRDTTLTLLEKRKVANFLMDVMRRDAQRSGANIPNPERDTFLPSGSSSTSTSNSSNGACENDLVDNDRPLEDFLAGERFKIASPLVQEFLVYGIAMALTPRSVGAKDGVDRICQYARSTGRFKDTTTPFIYPIYGSGEVPQAFSREAAVFSATYMLGRKAAAVVPPPGEGEDAAEVVLEEGGVKVKAKWVAVGAECLYEKCGTKYQRCVVVTDGPVIETGEGKCSFEFVVVPPLLPTLSAVQILQFGSVTGVVPRGVLHFVMKGDSSVREHLRKVVESLVDISGKDEKEKEKEEETPATTEGGEEEEKEEKEEKKEKKPSVVWCSFHTQTLCSVPEGLKEVKGLSVLPEPSELIDYKNVFEAAEKEFRKICTNGEEYLPKMPNPEDIIWSSEEKAEKDSGEKEEQKPKEGEDVKKSEVPAEEPAEVKPADVPAVTAEEEEEKTTTTTSNN